MVAYLPGGTLPPAASDRVEFISQLHRRYPDGIGQTLFFDRALWTRTATARA